MLMQDLFAFDLTFGRNDANHVSFLMRKRVFVYDMESAFSK